MARIEEHVIVDRAGDLIAVRNDLPGEEVDIDSHRLRGREGRWREW